MTQAIASDHEADVASSSERPPRPFLKWVGGKRQLLPHLRAARPQKFGVYFEPFLGGGAMFFDLLPPRAVLSDSNLRLVKTYRGVRDAVDEVIERLRSYPHDKDFYLEMRRRPIDDASDAETAAWFIYLNKTGFNGLYRVNRRNEVNVPFGSYANPRICDEPNLRACARALERAEIVHGDFDDIVARARARDFVYFDPPYVPLSATASFTSYTSESFADPDQVRLRDVARALKRRKVSVLLSNSSAERVKTLYADGFTLTPVLATRMVNSKATARGAITELLIS